jgi:elongation factor Ts
MPENKRAMIAEGKLKKRLKEVVLLDMPFIKNDKLSVQQQVDAVGKQAGVAISVKRFARIGAGA